MKYPIGLFALLLMACGGGSGNNADLQNRIDSLEQHAGNTFKPELGEFMTYIQIHHAKLWFAGTEGNWDLANFAVKEMDMTFSRAQQYCADRAELKSLPMITAPMDSMKKAVAAKDMQQFKSSFTLLTNTCNNCHRATQHAFNVITVPTTPPFSNQSFKPAQ
ncbi:hypothetical protein [Chitinophaga sp. HK235]|uniref:hypothetical protein n=1 Tax=Chitinophaga sp. HK235 TaxID=2952571 RepID=UPI001BAA755A|nr:hypothetical protein [Chitinophaga sp. HK235]